MLDKEGGFRRASEKLLEKTPQDQPWDIVQEHTMEIPKAWIFFYNSRKFIETGNVIHRLAGNGPIFVNKETGDVKFYGSLPPLEEIIRDY